MICFVDDYSRHIALYFLRRKADAATALRQYIDEHATPLNLKIRTIQSDGGGEFLGEFRDTCRINGIQQQFSAPDMQAQNSVAERTWRTIFSATLRMLEDAALPAPYWEEAAKTAAYVKNRIFSSTMDSVHDGRITPHEALWSEKPDLSLLRVWGSPAYVHVPPGKSRNSELGTQAKARRARPTSHFRRVHLQPQSLDVLRPSRPGVLHLARRRLQRTRLRPRPHTHPSQTATTARARTKPTPRRLHPR